ncbi:MAG: M14 family zinc carboxypeptidase [Planctomycetota bacterium]
MHTIEPLETRRLLSGNLITRGIYHTAAQLESELRGLADAYPTLAAVEQVGTSELGAPIWGLNISDNVGTQEDEPEFRWIGAMHGDETVGQALALYFADDVLGGYGSDARMTEMVDETDIWIVPQMNPDGYAARWRWNANFIDLNRSFPEGSLGDGIGTYFEGDPLLDTNREAETASIMRFSADRSFNLSANIHSGALVANYPYDSDGKGSNYSATPDDALFRELALTYSRENLPMYNSPFFSDGITNGADWYEVRGGFQDWTYRYLGTMDLTIEVSNTKNPSASTLNSFWADNRESMLSFTEAVQWGVRGVVTDADTGLPLQAKITIGGNTQPAFTDPDVGDYHRLLLPGTYDVTVEADGYDAVTMQDIAVTGGSATRFDVELSPTDLTSPALVFSEYAINAPTPTVSMLFDEPVDASADPSDLRVTRDGDGFELPSNQISLAFADEGRGVDFVFDGPLPDGNWTAELRPGALTDAAGNAAEATQTFFTLAGDADRDRDVDLSDFGILRANFGKLNASFADGDFNYDGNVDLSDFGILRAGFGNTLVAAADDSLFEDVA